MNHDTLLPGYIPRPEELQIRQEAAHVRQDGMSRAVLLYGEGGVGKTWLLRALKAAAGADTATIWLDPIDLDDSAYWLLSNLERKVAEQLDPENTYFGPHQEYLSRLPGYVRRRIGHETVVSHLGRIKQIFVECYKKFVEESGKTVAIAFDTAETIRGMYLLLTLTQWMKGLPTTLFILSGRPPRGHGEPHDPIKDELEDPHQHLPVTTIRLGAFSQEAAADYLAASRVGSSLTRTEKAKLVRLTRGHPLWLAFTISYLDERGMPEEAEAPLADIERDVPYRGDMTKAGQALHEAFKRRLVTPYRDADFWHEAIKRLAVVRQSISKPMWLQLMADRPLPSDVASLDEAWDVLLRTPWIRPRANRRYVTLHDAVAEELALRIIALHDQDQQWRRQLWQRAVGIYGELTEDPEAGLTREFAALDERLGRWDERPGREAQDRLSADDVSAFIREVARLDAEKRELDQFRASRLYYQLLCDHARGCRQFLDLIDQAKKQHDVLFEDLLALEMQRFLPGGDEPYAFGDVVGGVIDDFREWLSSQSPELYLDIGISMADYFIDNEHPEMAIELLDRLPEAMADHRRRYRLGILRGNAFMRIPGRVRDGLPHFRGALDEALAMPSADRQKLVAEAYKDLGFYYRNEGLWQEADEAYQQARDAISAILSARSSDDDREEMASIQTNWAYVKALSGSYRDGSNLVESAITVRHRLGKHNAEGISWSVCGEVYRYERRFQKAWDAFAEAERIFQGPRDWSWLGLVYQEQAICLFQAAQDGVILIPGRDSRQEAKRLITTALDICRDRNVRAYPSALNRAGRIYGQEDFDAGLGYLADGIDWAHRLRDGWFWFANLIEYVELSYRAWVKTGRREHRDEIAGHAAEIGSVMREYEFPDLRGRWDLLQGHLLIHDSLETGDEHGLSAALGHYERGFALIAQGYVGSSGASAIPGEFRAFGELFAQLPPHVRGGWQEHLRRAWSDLEHGSTLLLARLEELY